MNTPDSDDWMRIADRIVNDARRALEVIIALALVGCIGAALFGTPRADAQTACSAKPSCNPRDQADRTLCGPLLKGTTPTGQWEAYWWKAAPGLYCRAQWAMLDKYAVTDPRKLLEIAGAVAEGPELVGQIQAAMAAYGVTPPAGSQDEFDFKSLHYAACQTLYATPPPGVVWSGPSTCVAPTPPTLPGLSPYIVTPAGTATLRPAYPVVAGKRSNTATGTATPGAPCDCAALQIMEFNVFRYCAAPSITGISGPAVTACTARPK